MLRLRAKRATSAMSIRSLNLSPANRHPQWLLWLTLLFVLPLSAREGLPPLSRVQAVQPLAAVRQWSLPPTDVAAELAADAAAGQTVPMRYAVPSRVHLIPATDGTWEQIPGGRLWRLRVVSRGATDLNFGFSTFELPEGATLHICSENEDYFQGPYTARDNKLHGQLWTPVVPGEAAFIEMFVPAQVGAEPRLVLSQVGSGYRDLFHRRKDLGIPKAGGCEIDVVCPQAAAWSNEVRSVARYSVSGSGLCTGTLIADATRDLRSFFLTANHCVDPDTAPSVVVYWNYQSPICGELGGGSLAQNQSGSTFRAGKFDVDFTLVELDEIPDPSFQVYYSGWDRSGAAPSGAVGIHHPGGGEKAISFSTTPLTTANSCIGSGGVATHWQVVWSAGVTEPGSSGSGIWSPVTHQFMGTLSGGNSSCASPGAPDCYGKFSVAWGSGASASTRLREWLDPLNTGVLSIPGVDPHRIYIMAAGMDVVEESCLPTNGVVDPGETVIVALALRNAGRENTTDLVASLLPAGGVVNPSSPQHYGTVQAGGAPVAQSFTFVAAGSCGGIIHPRLRLQDGTNVLDDVVFNLTLGTANVVLSENLDTVVAPDLPPGWTASVTGSGSPWATVTDQADTVPTAAFADDIDALSDNRLTSPSVDLASSDVQLAFRHSYDLEMGSTTGFDGGVLEIAINGGAFTDILSAGGSFLENGYNVTMSTRYQNPLAGRPAWSGNSGGFVTTTVTLPPSAAGFPIRLRWRLGCDRNRAGIGWYVDTISLTDGHSCCRSLVSPRIVNTRRKGDDLVFSYDAAPGQSYVVESRQDVRDAAWTAMDTNIGDGTLKSFTNTISGASQRFFRLRSE
jgi:hypothetical protein